LKRGLTQASIETFELGYAPHSYEALLGHLSGKGHSLEQMAEVGLLIERDSGGYYDKFRNRIMFPIRDGAGKMAGFGARVLDPEDVPKFLNSPQTPLFNKSHLLYGLNLAKKAIRDADQVVIVEGYLDVIALHQNGFANSVSPMGTALNEDQLRYLKKYTRRIVLALDADAAGEKATLRGVEVARQALDRETELTYDPRGLLKHEARLQADVRVTTLPPGLDPDDVVLKDKQDWQHVLESAKPIVVHVMETLAAGQNLEDAKVKSAIAAQVTPLIEDVPSAVERDTYRQQLARLLKIDERSLMGNQKVRERPRRSATGLPQETQTTSTQAAARTTDNRTLQMEKHFLTLLLRDAARFYELERRLKSAGVDSLSAADFEDAQNNELVRCLMKGMKQDSLDVLDYLKENAGDDFEERLLELIAENSIKTTVNEVILSDLYRTLISLRLIRINQVISQLRYLQEEENADRDDQVLQSMILNNTIARGKLDLALAKSS
jgi:DNA primase